MNYCNIINEEGPDTIEGCNRLIQKLEDLKTVVKKDKQISEREIATRYNILFYETGCFCKVKIKTDKRRFRHIKTVPQVYFYTDNLWLIKELILTVYDEYIQLDHSMDDFPTIGREGYYILAIPYPKLKESLISCLDSEIEGIEEWRDEALYSDG